MRALPTVHVTMFLNTKYSSPPPMCDWIRTTVLHVWYMLGPQNIQFVDAPPDTVECAEKASQSEAEDAAWAWQDHIWSAAAS